jgi:hypothetical protein
MDLAINGKNSNGFTPALVNAALHGLVHRFILVIECEERRYEGEESRGPPRFCVGALRASLDPRNVSINDLVPLGEAKVDLPKGWEKVHEFLYGNYNFKQWPIHEVIMIISLLS